MAAKISNAQVKPARYSGAPVIVGGYEVCPDRRVFKGSTFKLHVEADSGAHVLPRKKGRNPLTINRLLMMGGGDVSLEPVNERPDGGFLLGAGASYCLNYGDNKSAMIVIPADLSAYSS